MSSNSQLHGGGTSAHYVVRSLSPLCDNESADSVSLTTQAFAKTEYICLSRENNYALTLSFTYICKYIGYILTIQYISTITKPRKKRGEGGLYEKREGKGN